MLSCSAVMTGFFSSWPPCRIPLQDQWPLPAGRSRLHIQPPCDLAVYLQIWVCNGQLRAPRLMRTVMSGSPSLSKCYVYPNRPLDCPSPCASLRGTNCALGDPKNSRFHSRAICTQDLSIWVERPPKEYFSNEKAPFLELAVPGNVAEGQLKGNFWEVVQI